MFILYFGRYSKSSSNLSYECHPAFIIQYLQILMILLLKWLITGVSSLLLKQFLNGAKLLIFTSLSEQFYLLPICCLLVVLPYDAGTGESTVTYLEILKSLSLAGRTRRWSIKQCPAGLWGWSTWWRSFWTTTANATGTVNLPSLHLYVTCMSTALV